MRFTTNAWWQTSIPIRKLFQFSCFGAVKELLGSLAVQTCKDFEVIIVEDGSQERSEQVVTSYGDLLDVKYFYKENSGPGLSRNYGANCAGGEYLLFLDSDCIVPPEYIAVIKQVRRLW